MRKFRLIKWDNDYNPLKLNEVYDADLIPEGWGTNIRWNADNYPDEWQEVFEQEETANTSPLPEGYIQPPVVNTKPLHKDTDLGYFVGIVFPMLFTKAEFYVQKHGTDEWMDKLIDHSIFVAKQLIKQLDAEPQQNNIHDQR